jgi:hypothetical protein
LGHPAVFYLDTDFEDVAEDQEEGQGAAHHQEDGEDETEDVKNGQDEPVSSLRLYSG